MTYTNLADAVDALPAKDRDFARSLVSAQRNRGSLSDKQMHWYRVLLDRANNPRAEAAQIGNVKGVIALFDRARRHLKYPKIVLQIDGQHVRLSVAGTASKYCGSINIDDGGNDFCSRTWFGRVTPEGVFAPGGKTTPRMASELTRVLTQLAQAPAAVAAEHGRLTGHCCFGNRHLQDERSTAVGYGPVCADHFGVPWGEQKTDFSTLAADAA
jgi:hypothetical protein